MIKGQRCALSFLQEMGIMMRCTKVLVVCSYLANAGSLYTREPRALPCQWYFVKFTHCLFANSTKGVVRILCF